MRTFHLYFSALALSALLIGTSLIPDNPVFWLASDGMATQILRFILVAFVMAQLITAPPRNLVLRAATGAISLLAVAWGIHELVSYNALLLDTIIFLQTAAALGVNALERPEEDETIYSKHAKQGL